MDSSQPDAPLAALDLAHLLQRTGRDNEAVHGSSGRPMAATSTRPVNSWTAWDAATWPSNYSVTPPNAVPLSRWIASLNGSNGSDTQTRQNDYDDSGSSRAA
jgi:hypothetical protein